MGNCLKTKLKGVVNNNNLPFLGCVIFRYTKQTNPSSVSYLRFGNHNKDITVKCLEGNYIYANQSATGAATDEVVANAGVQTYVSLANEDLTLIVDFKYTDFSALIFLVKGLGWDFNIDDLAYSHITYFDVADYSTKRTGIIGDIKNLIDVPITYLDIANTNISGDIINLAKNRTLGNFGIQNTNINGAIESYVNEKVSQGVSENTAYTTTRGLLNCCTLNGDSYTPGTVNQFLGWSSNGSKIVVKYGSSSLDGCTGAYVKGYTKAEAISEIVGTSAISSINNVITTDNWNGTE
jgi:hypothetical protein